MELNFRTEIDELTAQVILANGQQTKEIAVDLRQGNSKSSGGDDLVDCGRGPTIQVSTWIKQQPMQVFVKTLRGNTITCNLTVASLVGDLEGYTTSQTGVPESQYNLNFQGRRLACKDNLLVDYGVKNESTVFMMGRLRGGSDWAYTSGRHLRYELPVSKLQFDQHSILPQGTIPSVERCSKKQQ